MSIYTRTGDTGTTAIFGGKRLSKSDIQIEAYGEVDELTSFIGLVIAKTSHKDEKELLTNIQKSLYQIMGYMAGAKIDVSQLSQEVIIFEKTIDAAEKTLPKLNRFVLPQGGEVSSLYHILRTVCRRSERNVVQWYLSKKEYDEMKTIIKYLNRLSDLFFTLARKNVEGEEVVT